MSSSSETPKEPLAVYRREGNTLKRVPGDIRDPNRRYAFVADVGNNTNFYREFTFEEEAARDQEEEQWRRDAPAREAARAKELIDAEIIRASLRYENRFVAFVDILGWSQATINSLENPAGVERMGLVLHQFDAHAKFLKSMREIASNSCNPAFYGDLRLTHFSDCIVISSAPDVAGLRLLEDTLRNFTLRFASQGWLLRGGVTEGYIHHSDTAVYGPALVTAHLLESKKAVYPRIVLDPHLLSGVPTSTKIYARDGTVCGVLEHWRCDTDGYWYLNFLPPRQHMHPPEKATNIDIRILQEIRSTVEREIVRPAVDDRTIRIREKYLWMAKVFNEACAAEPQNGIEPINPG